MTHNSLIFHIDVNSAYLSWEAVSRLHIKGERIDLREIPAIIGGDQDKRHGIVLAKSIKAKEHKIHTGEAISAALQKCPNLVVVPPNYELYVKASRELMKLLRGFSPKVEQYSIDEAFIDMSGTELLYGSPTIIANHLKNVIQEEFKYTVNIGISTNKLLAKMAGDLKKPNMVHTLYQEEIPKKMWPLPVGELFYVGKATKNKLMNLGIRTIGELANTDPGVLRNYLGKHGEVLYQFAHGIDASPFLVQQVANKGYGNSITTPCDVITSEYAKMVLLSLTETVCTRLRKDRVKGRTIAVSLKDYNFKSISHQGNLYEASNITEEIYQCVCHIFDELWDQSTPIRQLGVHVSHIDNIQKESFMQYNLFDLDHYEKLQKLDDAIDQIRNRFGDDSVMRASFLNTSIYHMYGGTSKDRKNGITKPIL